MDASVDLGLGVSCIDEAGPLAAPVPELASSCPCVAPTSQYSALQPLGFGYRTFVDDIPARTAYLTFDDGPSEWTDEILDTLAAKNVHATFFVNARNFKGSLGLDGIFTTASGEQRVFRDVLRRASEEGHSIGNHTVDHLDLATLDVAKTASELDENEELVNAALVKAGGIPRLLTLIRPPWGSPWYRQEPPANELDLVGRTIANRGINVLWTLDSTDSREWAQGESYTRVPGKIVPDPGSPSYADKTARIKTTVLSAPAVAAGAGAIILFHDTHDTTRDVIGDVIDGLRAAGYGFGTIEQLVVARWGRPSLSMTPGPHLFSACSAPVDWGCDRSTPSHPICGRMWRAYDEAGGSATFGAALGDLVTNTATGALSQAFELRDIQLHPEMPKPCSATASPR
jgi:peptidoglycan/xylan/chitin deacetylase (PgdA/CDA1 family)